MSKKLESLFGDMKKIFGESFGSEKPAVINLSESVELYLTEKSRGFTQGGNFPRSSMPKGKHFPPEHKRRDMPTVAKKSSGDFSALSKGSAKGQEHAKRADKAREKSAETGFGGGSGGAKSSHTVGQGHEHGAPRGMGGGGGGGNTHHNPFKRSSNLGTGPGTPPGFKGTGPRHHDQAKCWSCKCGNVYTKGCVCTGTGASKDCKKGEIKHVMIRRDYRKAYNDMYHKWRRGQHGAVTKRLQSK